MPDLTTLCKQKTFLQIAEDDTSRDKTLRQLITQVSGLIEEWCGRSFGPAEYTEFYSGDNTPILILNQRPVTAIVSIYEDEYGYWGQGPDPFNAETLLTEGEGYALEVDQPDGSSRCGMVMRLNGSWCRPSRVEAGNLSQWAPYGTGNIKVVYTAGYQRVPAGVELATQEAVAAILRSAKYGGAMVASENTPGYSYTLATNTMSAEDNVSLPPAVISKLARYRNIPIA